VPKPSDLDLFLTFQHFDDDQVAKEKRIREAALAYGKALDADLFLSTHCRHKASEALVESVAWAMQGIKTGI
jgi:hypothetical protein